MTFDSRLQSLKRKEERYHRELESMSGSGRYIYKNMTQADYNLPKAAENGARWIPPGASFVGDSYFQKLFPDIQATEVLEIGQPPESKEREATVFNTVSPPTPQINQNEPPQTVVLPPLMSEVNNVLQTASSNTTNNFPLPTPPSNQVIPPITVPNPPNNTVFVPPAPPEMSTMMVKKSTKLNMPPIGTNLEAKYKHKQYTAQIVESESEPGIGEVLFDGVRYKTLTSAARAISSAINTGRVWKIIKE